MAAQSQQHEAEQQRKRGADDDRKGPGGGNRNSARLQNCARIGAEPEKRGDAEQRISGTMLCRFVISIP
jgi:hypothetical protein